MTTPVVRLLTALVGIPLVLGLMYVGGWPFLMLILAAALLAQYELYLLFDAARANPHKLIGLTMGALVALGPLFPEGLTLALGVGLALITLSPFLDQKKTSPAGLAATFFGVLYPTGLLTCLTYIRLGQGPDGSNFEAFGLTMATVVLIWVNDTFAYYAGKAAGKHALAPTISPKKTWEGTIAGLIGTGLGAVIFKLTLLSSLAWPHIVVLAFLCGVVGQLGDLAESKMKRFVHVKDSGTLLPGHGGLLDRFDAMILVAPAVYLYFFYVVVLF